MSRESTSRDMLFTHLPKHSSTRSQRIQMQLKRKSPPALLVVLSLLMLSALSNSRLHSQQVSNETREIIGSASVGIGGTSGGVAGVLFSPSFIVKSRFFAFTVAPLNLIFTNDRTESQVLSGQGTVLQCNVNNPTYAGNAACPRFHSHWRAVSDVAVRLPNSIAYAGAGVAIFESRVIPVGTMTAYFGQSTNKQWMVRGVLGNLYVNLGVGVTHVF